MATVAQASLRHETEAPAVGTDFLVVDSISKSYGSVPALQSVSFTLQRGELLALLGPSGCGKSTLLNVISGFLSANQGRIILNGVDVSKVPPHRRGMPMVFQSYALFPHMTVFQNVAFGLKQRRVSKDEQARRVAEAMDLVQLPGYQNRYPAELSGGQQQRVALARCLVVRPPILLLDEPLSNLDAQLREGMRDEMNEILRAAEITTILVTHDQSEGLAIADRVLVLRDGSTEQTGTPLEVYENPASRFAADFLGVSNLWPGTLHETSSGVFVETELGSIKVDGRSHFADGDTVVVAVRPDRVQVLPSQYAPAQAVSSGVVSASSYLGRQRRVRIECAANVVVVADIDGGARNFGVGSKVQIAVDSPDCLLVRP